MKNEILGMGGGSLSEVGIEASSESHLGCYVDYTGKAPDAVVKLRTAARKNKLFVKTYTNALRRKDQRCNRLQLAGDLTAVVCELGMVNIAFAQQVYDMGAGRRKDD